MQFEVCYNDCAKFQLLPLIKSGLAFLLKGGYNYLPLQCAITITWPIYHVHALLSTHPFLMSVIPANNGQPDLQD